MRKIFAFLMAIIILMSTPSGSGTDSVCSIVGQARQYYLNDYDKFWTILHENDSNIGAYSSSEETTCFLRIGIELSGNAEFGEHFHEVLLHNVIFKNPDCFFKSLSLLERCAQEMLLWQLTHMYSEEDKGTIYHIVMSFENCGEYRELISLFYIMKDSQAPFIDD